MTSSKMRRKLAFSENEFGVGGMAVQVPRATFLDGGSFSSKVRMCDDDEASLKTFCHDVSGCRRWCGWRLTMCEFPGSVVNGLHCDIMRLVLTNAREENMMS